MSQIQESVVLIHGSNPDSDFGTAFIIAHDDNFSYLLTCAHVVEKINGNKESKLRV